MLKILLNIFLGYIRLHLLFQPRSKDELTIGKKHALKKYDHFALNTSCFWWGSNPYQILPQLCNFTKFLLQK